MAQNVLERLVNEWIHEPLFRQAMLVDPEGTIRQGGLQLDELAWSVVRCLDWSLPSEALKALLCKVGVATGPSNDSWRQGEPNNLATSEVEEQETSEWSTLEGIYNLYERGLISTEQYSKLLSTLTQTS